jgi:hypothetical protein
MNALRLLAATIALAFLAAAVASLPAKWHTQDRKVSSAARGVR